MKCYMVSPAASFVISVAPFAEPVAPPLAPFAAPLAPVRDAPVPFVMSQSRS